MDFQYIILFRADDVYFMFEHINFVWCIKKKQGTIINKKK